MRHRRSVADLAGHGLVAGLAMGLNNLPVAHGAGLAAGVPNRLLRDGRERRCAVVPPLAEGLGHQEMASHNQSTAKNGKND